MQTFVTISALNRMKRTGAAMVAAAAIMVSGFTASDAVAGPASYSAFGSTSLSIAAVRNSFGDVIAPPAGLSFGSFAEVIPDATDPGDIGFESGSFAEAPSTASNFGSAVFSSSGFSLGGGVSGTAFSTSNTFSLQLTQGFFDVINASGEDLIVDFALSYGWLTGGSVTPDGFAGAIASLILDVTDDAGFATLLDIFDVSETTDGSEGCDVDTTFFFSLAVADGTTAFVDVYFDLAGSAVVPAPASLLVLGFGLLALRRVRKSAEARAQWFR